MVKINQIIIDNGQLIPQVKYIYYILKFNGSRIFVDWC